MPNDSWAQVAKITSQDRQWKAEIGFYSAKTSEGMPTGFVCHDTLYADSKQAAIAAAKQHYPAIVVETMFDHLTKPSGPAFRHG